MRADRLIALLLLMQRRQRVTAAEVAAELEVSERTARRDLEALGIAGLPVYSERGRGGGWRLLGGGRTDLSGLSAAEARALFLVAGPQAHATPELRAALRKLVRALPEPMRGPAEGAASSVIVDPGRWGETRNPFRPPHLEAIEAALADGVQVRLGYADRSGKASLRTVHPFGLALKGTVWYLLAGTGDGLRTFRVSRVTSVEPTGELVERPEGFDLAEAWKQVVRRVDELRTPLEVSALADPDALDELRWVFQRRATFGPPTADGRVPVTLRGQALRMLVFELAGFGRRVEVLSPPAVREQLATLGAELVGTYGRPGLGAVLDLPGVVEDVPSDSSGGVAGRPQPRVRARSRPTALAGGPG
jgi:predicted DNA-binding transcriptional regulator YafY